MDKINLCFKQKKGIKIIEPNENIGKEYIKESEIDLDNLSHNTLKWKNIIGYYACYNAFYALLQKVGIKSEIHDCTLALIDIFKLSSYKTFLENLKLSMVNVQYYLKKPDNVNEKQINEFVFECKDIFNKISFDDIQNIRKEIEMKKND